MSLIPKTDKAEFHITYICDLDCVACSRASFLSKPVVPNMTLDDALEFFRQADELNWHPRIIVIGGEPTLHPQFDEFCELIWKRTNIYAQVYSNGYTEKSRELLDRARLKWNASIEKTGWKPGGSITEKSDPVDFFGAPYKWDFNHFVSPMDAGVTRRGTCYCHASEICGISVDHLGYAPCGPGGALSALLDGRGRTTRLVDLFDQEKMAKLTNELCNHCGFRFPDRPSLEKLPDGVTRLDEDATFLKYGESCGRSQFVNTRLSPTWEAAFMGRK